MSASTDGIIFPSHGSKLLGTLYRPHGEGKKPTALLLHGIPGNEKNVDLAYALRDAGWNAVTFHYRGCWGSEGNYSLSGIVDDTIAAIDYLSQRDDVNMTRFAVVGMSLGGWGVVAAAARDDRIRAVISINPLVDPNDYVIGDDYAESFAAMLNGITPRELRSQWMGLTPLQDVASKLADRPTMLITGEADELFSVEHQKVLVDAFPSIEWWRIPNGTHIFGDHRVMLVRGIVDWLIKNLEGLRDLQGLAIRSPKESDHRSLMGAMKYDEILSLALHLSLNEQLMLIEILARSIRKKVESTPKRKSSLALMRGIIKPDGAMPTDEELKEDYVDYLIKKYL